MKLKQIIEDNDTKIGKIFDLTIQFLIIVSLISFSIETIPELSNTTTQVLKIIEIITVVIFSLEYICRFIVADDKINFIFSFYAIIDLLAILPFYITRGIDLRSIRIVRLFRLFRILKIFRYSSAIQRMKQAFLSIKEELVLFALATAFLLYISSVGIYYFENKAQPEEFKSIFHCLWWSIITLTTIGYGDAYPITTGGKIFTSIVSLIGIGIIAVPTGLVASALTKVIKNKEQD
jgi:voltage-gated potassium channel